jgi:hypothetical protein
MKAPQQRKAATMFTVRRRDPGVAPGNASGENFSERYPSPCAPFRRAICDAQALEFGSFVANSQHEFRANEPLVIFDLSDAIMGHL